MTQAAVLIVEDTTSLLQREYLGFLCSAHAPGFTPEDEFYVEGATDSPWSELIDQTRFTSWAEVDCFFVLTQTGNSWVVEELRNSFPSSTIIWHPAYPQSPSFLFEATYSCSQADWIKAVQTSRLERTCLSLADKVIVSNNPTAQLLAISTELQALYTLPSLPAPRGTGTPSDSQELLIFVDSRRTSHLEALLRFEEAVLPALLESTPALRLRIPGLAKRAELFPKINQRLSTQPLRSLTEESIRAVLHLFREPVSFSQELQTCVAEGLPVVCLGDPSEIGPGLEKVFVSADDLEHLQQVLGPLLQDIDSWLAEVEKQQAALQDSNDSPRELFDLQQVKYSESDRESTTYQLLKGFDLCEQGSFEDARSCFDSVVDQEVDNPNALLGLCSVASRTERYNDAFYLGRSSPLS